VLKVHSLDTWKAVLREGLDWTDETWEGSPHLRARGTHPRGSSTQERDRGRRDQAEVLWGRPPQDHADSTQGNNPRRDEGLRSDLPLYHNGEMDEAEPDMEEIESRTTGVLQEEGEPGEACRSCNPCDQSLSPSPPIPGSRGANTQPEHHQCWEFLGKVEFGLVIHFSPCLAISKVLHGFIKIW
jgi:hypothetical protein